MFIDFSKFEPNAAEITSLDISRAILQFGLPGNLSSDMPEGGSKGRELPPYLVRILARISDDMVYMGMNFIRMTIHKVADNCLDLTISEENRKIWLSYFYLFLRRDIEKEVAIINNSGRFISDARTHHAVMSLMTMCLKFGEMTYFLPLTLSCNMIMEYMRQLPMWLLEHVDGARDLLKDATSEISSHVADFLEKSSRVIGTRQRHL